MTQVPDRGVDPVSIVVGEDSDDLPLAAESVSVSFGGVRAVRDASVRVGPGEIVGLIGGNGAGKTTFLDCVSGFVEPSPESRMTCFGHDLGPLPPEVRPYVGVVRSFQDARLYPELTVTEALLVSVERHRPTGVFAGLFHTRAGRSVEREKLALVDEIVESFGLDDFRGKRISELSTGTRRVVDLASLAGQRPRLLLLDEPTSGLAQKETEAFGPMLEWLRGHLDCAVLLIEHDMPLMRTVADRLYAFETGSIIAEGSPEEVLSDAAVIAGYLGLDDVAINRSGAVPARAATERSPNGNGRRRRSEPLRAAPRTTAPAASGTATTGDR